MKNVVNVEKFIREESESHRKLVANRLPLKDIYESYGEKLIEAEDSEMGSGYKGICHMCSDDDFFIAKYRNQKRVSCYRCKSCKKDTNKSKFGYVTRYVAEKEGFYKDGKADEGRAADLVLRKYSYELEPFISKNQVVGCKRIKAVAEINKSKSVYIVECLHCNKEYEIRCYNVAIRESAGCKSCAKKEDRKSCQGCVKKETADYNHKIKEPDTLNTTTPNSVYHIIELLKAFNLDDIRMVIDFCKGREARLTYSNKDK